MWIRKFKRKSQFVYRKANFWTIFKETALILLGIASAAFGLKSFLLPNNFLDGGAMGISLLLNIKTGLGLGLILVVVNIPFVLLGLKQISRAFAIKTIMAIATLALV